MPWTFWQHSSALSRRPLLSRRYALSVRTGHGHAPEDPLGILLEDLGRAQLTRAIELGPLAAAEAGELLTELLIGTDAVAGSHRTLANQVLRRAGAAIPRELCAGAWSGDWVGVSHRVVPRDIAQGVQQRVAALPKVAQELLGVAAVAGRHVPRSVVLTVACRSGRSEADTLMG